MQRIIFCLIALMFSACSGLSQDILSTKSKKAIELYTEADNFRVRGQYDQAIALLSQAIDKDKKFEEAYYRLGITYRSSGNLALANDSFEKGLALVKDSKAERAYQFVLASNYLRIGNYDQSLKCSTRFLELEKTDRPKAEQAAVWKSQAMYGKTHQTETYPYRINPLSDTVNAYPMQYFPAITADDQELIFTVRFGKAHDDNEDIVVSRKSKNGHWEKPASISGNINTAYREGACTISADGRQLIFTICGPHGCDLYESKRQGDQWSKPVSLGSAVNSAAWEAQPTLSADGNELYFISDRKGGVGGYDIWYSRKNGAGTWGKSINLGKTVNTPFDEIAPFIHVNNQNLYFASNGLPGFGNYDIYVAERKSGQWSEPVNMGAPLNDFEDQYSFTVTSSGKEAYYSKEEGRNKSKLYRTTIPDQFLVRSKGNIVRGQVTNALNKNPLKAEVELYDLKLNSRISVFESDSVTGTYLIVLPGKSEYALHVVKPGFLFLSLHFNYVESDQEKPLLIDLQLQPMGKNAATVLNNIFFDLNQFELKPRSFTELDEVVVFMNANPSVKVEISGHTDNSGTENYNLQLSQKRAQAVTAYLTAKGIESSRIIQKGYGSQKPLKANDSEENKQANRRIEFKIIN